MRAKNNKCKVCGEPCSEQYCSPKHYTLDKNRYTDENPLACEICKDYPLGHTCTNVSIC